MNRTLLLFLAVALFAACKAHMLETHGDGRQLFKTGLEKPGRGGVVRYLQNGLASMRNARRADAEKQMKGFCGGSYAITAEGPRSKLKNTVPIPKGALELDEYNYIVFECSTAAAKAK